MKPSERIGTITGEKIASLGLPTNIILTTQDTNTVILHAIIEYLDEQAEKGGGV